MEHVGAEGYEGWERGVGRWEGDLEAEDRGCVGSLSYEYDAGPECWVAGSEAHEYSMRAGVFETGELYKQMLLPHSG